MWQLSASDRLRVTGYKIFITCILCGAHAYFSSHHCHRIGEGIDIEI